MTFWYYSIQFYINTHRKIMLKRILLTSLFLITTTSFAQTENRHQRITSQAELDEEIVYLMKKFNYEKPDTLIRLVDYVNRNSEVRGYVINKFSMSATKNDKKGKNVRFIVDYISQNIVELDTHNIPKNGEWQGQSGHSLFFINSNTKSYSLEEMRQAAPYGIPFEYGYPNFTSFRVGDLIPIDKPTASYPHDYEKTVNQIIMEKKPVNGIVFNDVAEFKEYIQANFINLHYAHDENAFEFLPNTIVSVIDYELPHVSKRKPH